MVGSRRWQEDIEALAERLRVLQVLMLPDLERAERIGSLWKPQDTILRRAADRLRGDRVLGAVLVGMLRESDR